MPEEEAGERYTRVTVYWRVLMPSCEAERALAQLLADAPRRTAG
ncbi:MAG: hypothetical protein M5U01_22570 [Ardenticatenaceae bacterium]|nr:hypothetical protein [Ardenticatenaceae bacterium]